MKKIILLLLVSCTLWLSIHVAQRPVVQVKDIQSYLQPQHFHLAQQKLEEQLNFWSERLTPQPENNVYQQKVAGLQARYFRLSGDVQYLHRSDSTLEALADRFPKKVAYWHALAQNAISGHQFAKADKYINQALALGEKRYQSSLIKVDVLLERGKPLEAKGLLNALGSTHNFDYAIRQVKLQDELGELGTAIQFMEKAAHSAQASGNHVLINWSQANLADMYGHQGKIRKSYRTYLKALQHDPADLHALKGIAWIAFSHDKNPDLATEIIQFLQSIHSIPDYELQLAEIADYKKDRTQAELHRQQFLDKINHQSYGFLYTKPLTQLQMERGEIKDDELIEAEITQRPHPLSYLLKAQYLQYRGQEEAAFELIKDKVLTKTEEPHALFQAGLICKASGQDKMARKLLKAAQEAAFELGPMVSADIKRALREL